MDLRGIIYQVCLKKPKVAVTLAERLTGREEAESEQGASDLHGKGSCLRCLMFSVLEDSTCCFSFLFSSLYFRF